MLFFITLNFNHKVLYAPGDFGDGKHFLSTFEEGKHFLAVLGGDYIEGKGKVDSLKSFWKPDGKNVDRENEKIIHDWMTRNGLNLSSISAFLYSRDEQYSKFRKKAIDDLGITGGDHNETRESS
uniref:Uncharacterized protein n=1 Tax=Candidatus Kentrum sp. TC TaxID=2126339 RepID=A0A450ZW34_9GAMM|nr:MAG: hypothetical protein BECKTC1821F_GA0114240_102131 [Candidatus Kentron sp. TC]